MVSHLQCTFTSCVHVGLLEINRVFWLGTFLNPPKSISALLETCPHLQNAPCIFVDLSYSALMACTSRQVVILPHLKRWKYSFQQCWIFPPKKCPLEDFDGFGVVRINKQCTIVYTFIYKYVYMYNVQQFRTYYISVPVQRSNYVHVHWSFLFTIIKKKPASCIWLIHSLHACNWLCIM